MCFPAVSCHKATKDRRKMVFLGFSPYFIFSSYLTTLLLGRGVHVAGNKQFSTSSSPWYPAPAPLRTAKASKVDPEALKTVLPLVTFDCKSKTGYFTDSKFNCEVFHYCQPNGARSTFHCPNNQLFNQLTMVCEEKSTYNSRICKEGSISSPKFHKNSGNRKHEVLHKSFMQPPLDDTKSKEPPKKVLTLEELLSYMNSGQLNKESEPTFMSNFHAASDAKKLKPSVTNTVKPQHNKFTTVKPHHSKIPTVKPEYSIIPTLKPELKSVQDEKHLNPYVHLEAQGSNVSISVVKTQSEFGSYSKTNSEGGESVPTDTNERVRKVRKHKRVGRVLDVPADQQPKKENENKPYEHVTLDSLSEVNREEITTVPPADDVVARTNNNPSLFSADRNKAKDIRKRKRYQGRKRKVSPTIVNNDTDIEMTTTMSSTTLTTKQDMEPTRSNNYRRRKSQRTRVRDDSLRIVQKAKKVEPYTLPPLPIPEEVQLEAATESMPKEEKQSLRDSRSKNPYHKPTTPPATDGVQFGEKLSDLDQHHYQTDVEMMEGPAPPAEYYKSEGTTDAYEDMFREEKREKMVTHAENMDDLESSHTMQTKKFRLHDDSDRYKAETYYENHHSTLPQNLFPPPRAEPREHHSTPPQQMVIPHKADAEKPKSHSSLKASTEEPFRVTHPYLSKYKSGDQDLKDIEEKRWKLDSEKSKKSEMKVEVGSTFSQDPVTPETTRKPKLQITSTTEVPVTDDSSNKEKAMFKHTLAHQHLSKIMNDFFAMSSSGIQGRDHLESIKNKEELVVPEYRIPDEDIYAGAESGTEDMEELPQELLDVVDLLTGHADKVKGDLKPQTSHEIIKIDGPITDSHIEKIFLDEKSEEEFDKKHSSEGSFKKIVILPEPTDDKEEIEDLSDMDEFTSLKLEPLLKHISDERSMKVIPLKTEPVVKRQPSLLSAKQIPVRVIYSHQLSDAVRSKLATRKPNVKIIQNPQTVPQRKGKRPATTPISHSFGSSRIVLHPSSIFPPHSVPSISRKQIPFRIGYPFVTNPRSNVRNSQIHRRRKRSVMSRLRRQIQQNQHFSPFSSPVFPSFNPRFAPTFSPFKSIFSPISLRPSSSHMNPFSFPGIPVAKPSQNRPHIFQPSHSRPQPVRHVTPAGHPTVIVEEVPVPIHVEVPSPNLLRPMPSGNHMSKPNDRYPRNQYRTPSPPAIQTPPLLQGPQHHRFPVPLMSHQTNHYSPHGMPPNHQPRSPPINYQSPIPVSGPLPQSITSQGQVYALGVTNKPIIPSNNHPPRPPNGGPRPFKNHPPPYNHFDVHASAYPNFPYFQGAFTTPISNEPVVGRLMYSGYKPPKSTTGTKPPKTEPKSNKDRNTSESKSSRSRSKPTVEYFEAPAKPVQDYFEAPARPALDYFEAPAKPLRESHVSYTEEVIQRERPRPKSHSSDYSIDHTDLKPPRQSISSNSGSSDEIIPRKRRPGKRRRPRPQSTTQGTPILNNISPTPPPPEQIPPPPADYTSKPSTHEFVSSFPISNEGKKGQDTSSHYPPAGYYGKDQLIQFFDSTPNSYQKATSPKPYIHRELGESRSTAERDESVTSLSEDGEPVFGTRLRSKPRSQSRNRQLRNNQPVRSQTQTTEVRTRPSNKPDETVEKKKQFTPPRPKENNNAPVRDERPPPRRRKPPPPRPQSRPPSRPAPPREVHHYKYNENMGGFYSVPRGLQNFVAPGDHPQQGFRGSTDMFGIPHPVIDPSIYSLRPQGATDFDPNFFSVPAHVAKEQQSPLRSMNIKPIPESAREFFTAPETGSKAVPDESAPKKKETEIKTQETKTAEENNEKDPPARKLRKPKRKNRYNPHSTEQRDSAEVSSAKPETEQTTTSRERTVRHREKSSTTVTTPESRSTAALNYPSQNDIKETTGVFKQRTPLLPKTLPELSQSLANGKIDIQKLNATISTSVSVSGAIPQTNNTSSEEKENKRVFSSQNGGLAVVKKGPKRKRPRQRVSTTTGVPYVNNDETSADAKYEIAASVLDIIKATTETERQALAHYTNSETPSSSKVSNTWVEKISDIRRT